MQKREKTKKILVKNVSIGGSKHIVIQSMTTCSAANISKTLLEINKLKFYKCEIVRVAILDENDALSLSTIIEKSPLPIVADIHFVPSLALEAIKSGVHKLRLNPGNIQDKNLLKQIILLAKKRNIPIRIGLNSGSITKDKELKYGSLEKAMIGLCDDYLKFFHDLEYDNIILSFKHSDATKNLKINELVAKTYSYPLHLGVTESGGEKFGIIKSCAGLAPLLVNGIGNTIRISLTTEPYKEVIVARQLLKALNLLNNGPDLVSCPTCGRMQKDITPIVKKIEEYLLKTQKNIKVSIIGCSVNGLGEASRSDIGLVGGNEKMLFFKKGKFIKTIEYKNVFEELIKEIDKFHS